MLEPGQQAMVDQAQSAITDMFPTFWASLYRRLMQEGFTAEQSMDLLKTYIVATLTTRS